MAKNSKGCKFVKLFKRSGDSQPVSKDDTFTKFCYYILILFLFVILNGVLVEGQDLTVAEYHFYGKSSSTTVFDPVNNSTTQSKYYTPVGRFGSSFSANEPTKLDMGILIEYGKWVVLDVIHYDQTGSTGDHRKFNMWLYYITGSLGTFVNIDWQFVGIYSSYQLQTYSSGNDLHINFTNRNLSEQFGPIEPGWNLLMFGGDNLYISYILGNVGDCIYDISDLTYQSHIFNSINKIGGYDGSDTSVSYIVHSLGFIQGIEGMFEVNYYPYVIPTNSYYGDTPTGGDSDLQSPETGDDGGAVDSDGGSSTCELEDGFTGTIGSPFVCTEVGGDGFNNLSTDPAYGDDGNNANGDGCSSTGAVESGYSGSGGSSTTADVGGSAETGGDGVLDGSRTPSTYCDDGNTNNGDGCSSTGSMETGYSCTGATISTADTCSPICGDSMKLTGEQGDDGNVVNGDGGSSSCTIEVGYSGSGGSSSTPDVGYDICGDGMISGTRSSSSYCDDGNVSDFDGCSSACEVETGYTCTGADSLTPDTCSPIGGDGLRISPEACDDGNVINFDGGNTDGSSIEATHTGSGGSSTTPDVCLPIGGDGKRTSQEIGDDGNTNNNDGCSSEGTTVEIDYVGGGGSLSGPDLCLNGDTGFEVDDFITPTSGLSIGGDGLRVGSEIGDDGNTIASDGGASDCNSADPNYIGVGGSNSSADTCTQGDSGFEPNDPSSPRTGVPVGGDGFKVSGEVGDDGNTISTDGCSNDGSYIENGWIGTGGTISSADIGTQGTSGSSPNSDHTLGESSAEASISTTAAVGALVGVGIVANVISSAANNSSPQSTFASINQIQLLLLMLFLGVYLPIKVEEYLISMTASLFGFDLLSLPIFSFMSYLFSPFEYEQPNSKLDEIDISSGSTLINLFNTFVGLLIMIIFNIITYIIYNTGMKNKTKNKKESRMQRFFKNSANSFKFGNYVRLLLEANMAMLLSGLSELYRYDNSSGTKSRSLASAYLTGLFGCLFIVITCINWLRKSSKDYFNSGTKTKVSARGYVFIFLLRRAIFCCIVMTIDVYYHNIKVILYIIVQVCHGIYIILVKPFEETKDNIIEIIHEVSFFVYVTSLLRLNSQQNWVNQLDVVYIWAIMASMITVTIVAIAYAITAVIRLCKNRMKTRPKLKTKITKVEELYKEDVNFDPPSESKLALNVSKINEESKEQLHDKEILKKSTFATNTPTLTPQPSTHFRKQFD